MKIIGHSAQRAVAMPSFKVTALAAALALAAPAVTLAQDDGDETALEEVVVTGSFLSRLRQSDLPSPTSVFGDDFLDDIGAANVADFVSNLTINNGSQNNPDAFTQGETAGTSNFNLRGLGVGSTLVLLNGRRQVTTGSVTNDGVNFVDTSSLVPNIALDRIEIVKDGAAAIYGTDAIAGVVNFITDDTFRGFAVDARAAAVTDEGSQEDLSLELKVGFGNDNTSVLLAGSFYDRTSLTTEERRLSSVADDSSALGNPGSFISVPLAGLGLPAPIIDPTGCAEQGGIPSPLGGPAQAAFDGLGLPFTAGTCQLDFGDFFNLVPEEQRVNLFGALTHDFGEDNQFRFEIAYADNDAERNNTPTFPFLQTGSSIVLANNPGNVFPEELTPLIFFGRVVGNGGEASPSQGSFETLRVSADIEGAFSPGGTWRYDLAATFGRNDTFLSIEDTVTDRVQAALFGFGGPDCDPTAFAPGTGPCQFFNPFATSFGPIPNDPALIDFLIDTQTVDAESELFVADAVFSGAIGSTAAAPIGLALGLQFRDESLSRDFDDLSNQDAFAFLVGNPDFESDRDIFAAFAELSIPITANLDIQAALRYEDYGGPIGDTLDPKVSILYRPTDAVSLRASFATGFRAPSIFQTNGDSTSLQQVTDPILGNQAFISVRTFAAPAEGRDLQPEESETFNIGASFSPGNFEIDIDYWNFEFTDAIIQENFQAIVDADPLGDQVLRDPITGTILFVFNNFVNASSIETDGLDISARYNIESNAGLFTPFIDLTNVFNYDIEDPQAGSVEGAGNRNFTNFGSPTPELRYTAGVNYVGNVINARIAYRFVDSFSDDQNMGAEIDSFETIDAQVGFNFTQNIAATVGVTNLTDEAPPSVATNGGFESRTHDPRGRLAYVQFSAEF